MPNCNKRKDRPGEEGRKEAFGRIIVHGFIAIPYRSSPHLRPVNVFLGVRGPFSGGIGTLRIALVSKSVLSEPSSSRTISVPTLDPGL